MLYGWSYENLLLLSRSAPDYGAGRDREESAEPDPARLADNPENFSICENSNIEDEEIIR